MARYFPLQLAAITLALSACVTINVYFPAAAAEKAADKIIEDVLGDSASSSNKRSSLVDGASRTLLAATAGVLNFLVPTAQAQSQADLNIATPAVRQLTQSMEARFAQLKKYLDSGAVGFTRDGLVEVRDQNLVALPERNAVRKLVADENADRANLYREIATANGHPEWESDIRSTFATRWASKAAAGWYVQDSSGAWKQK
ncbi:MAG TPA: YdbL family protein [Povalibacter sp.]|uniref:YdbL family protein n=1 Tax=Povalibacter sp. TaxID=1962978 RepID=UPI002C8919F5|nr:YdbL family protein [Povalibacter sp.]HMN44295.1 YdbL family protein [Povalibacter sp.]